MPPILNAISLPHRTDRLQSFLEQMNRQNIAFKMWEGNTDTDNPIININKAHKKIIRDAKEKNLPRVHVCEDDVLFSCDGAWKYYLSKIPSSFDFYCGVIYYGKWNDDGRIIKARSGILTLYTIHSKFYDDFLSIDNSVNLDWGLGELVKTKELYACLPFVVKQISGYSDHFKKVQDYSDYEAGKNFLT